MNCVVKTIKKHIPGSKVRYCILINMTMQNGVRKKYHNN